MAVSYKVGSFTVASGTAPYDQSVTGLGFQPKALILFSAQTSSTEDTITTSLVSNIGFSDGTTDKAISVSSEDDVGTSDSHRYADSSGILRMISAADGTMQARAELKTFDAGGFTLTWTFNTFGTNRHVKYIAIGGDDITDVDVGSFTSPASTGVQNVSTSVNTADFVMITAVGLTTEDDLQNHSLVTLGMATSSSNQGVSAIASENDVGTSDTHRYQRTDKVIGRIGTGSPVKIEEAEFDGFTASGFDLDWTTIHASAYHYYYITIKGGQWEVGNGTTPASNSTKSFTTTFEPKGLVLFGKNNTASTSVQNHATFLLGGADGTANVNIAEVDLNDRPATDSARYSSSTFCYAGLGSITATSEEADLDSFNATDFTLDFTKTASDAREFIWAVVGDNAASGTDDVLLVADGCNLLLADGTSNLILAESTGGGGGGGGADGTGTEPCLAPQGNESQNTPVKWCYPPQGHSS